MFQYLVYMSSNFVYVHITMLICTDSYDERTFVRWLPMSILFSK